MNAWLNRLILLGTMVPAAGAAQTVNVTGSTIRLFEQEGGNILPANRRVYTNYFNSLRTRYISVEVALDYTAATTSFTLSVGCEMTTPENRTIRGIFNIPVHINQGSTHAEDANTMFGMPEGQTWPVGLYKVTCTGSRQIGETNFQMSPGPSLLNDLELRLRGVKFFPTGPKVPPMAQRTYLSRFSGAEATRIGIELSFIHPAMAKPGPIPVDCYYLQRGNVLGTMSGTYNVEGTAGTLGMGLGWDQPGNWEKGDYMAICQIHGRPILVERFSVW